MDFNGTIQYHQLSVNATFWFFICSSITVVPVTDEATIAKIGIYETAFSKLINKVKYKKKEGKVKKNSLKS